MLQDEEVYRRLSQGDETCLKDFYTSHEVAFVKTIISKGWGQEEDAKRVYAECVTILYYNIKEGRLALPLRSSLKTYLIAISRNVLSNERRSDYNKKTVHIDPTDHTLDYLDGIAHLDYKEKSELMNLLLGSIGAKCRELLTMFYIKAYSAESVANALEIDNVSAVRKRKFDCLKKIKTLYEEHKAVLDKYR